MLAGALLAFAGHAMAQSIVLASTTSTEQSGLFAHLLPRFTQATGIAVRVVALGTGQALDVARRGDADVLLVHDATAEERFMAEGHGLSRRAVMYNDFVLVGPRSDPAGAHGSDVVQALQRIAAARAPFVSRGDNSGTHAAEQRFWALAQIEPGGAGYRACGCGMGQALNIAASSGAYALSDRGTWLAFRNRADLAVLVQGDRRLLNRYSVIVVNPARHPHVRVSEAQRFADWLVSPQGQQAIADYRIAGEPLFFPDAAR
jgi:tungstate transport system substrate-binding protein